MGVSDASKEVLFVLGEFFKATDRRFMSSPVSVSISKAEFIDAVRSNKAVSKQSRALYKNLEDLQKHKLILYNKAKELRMSRKGFTEYGKMSATVETLMDIKINMATKNVGFKRKIQTRLKY